MVKPEDRQQRQYNNRLYKNKKSQDISGFSKSFFTSCFILLAFIGIIYWEDLGSSFEEMKLLADGKRAPKFELQLPFSQKRQNILIMGVDVDNENHNMFKGNRTDTIVIASIAPGYKDVNVLSIPRDSKVYIPGTDKADKINHAFARGGIKESIKTIEGTFGIRINHYLIVTNKALINFIDAIDGLPIYVEKDMHYGDKTAKLYVNLKKGHQVLSGKEVEGYVRFRNDALGDIGRIRRQQHFFNALEEKLKDPKTLIKLPEAIKIALKSVKTDMSFYELSQYALLAKTLDKADIQTATIPGGPSQKGDISYWIVDPERCQALINKLIYREKPERLTRAPRCMIIYTKNAEERAFKVREALLKQGVEVNMQIRDQIPNEHISIRNLKIPMETIKEYKESIEELNGMQISLDDFSLEDTSKDFVVTFNK